MAPRKSGLPGAKEKERRKLGQEEREEFQATGVGAGKAATGYSVGVSPLDQGLLQLFCFLEEVVRGGC